MRVPGNEVGKIEEKSYDYNFFTNVIRPKRPFLAKKTFWGWGTLRHFVYISRQGTWADALVIQAVADALNLTIRIIESNPGFASITNIGSARSATDTTVINIGHLDEIHYVSTVPFNQSTT